MRQGGSLSGYWSVPTRNSCMSKPTLSMLTGKLKSRVHRTIRPWVPTLSSGPWPLHPFWSEVNSVQQREGESSINCAVSTAVQIWVDEGLFLSHPGTELADGLESLLRSTGKCSRACPGFWDKKLVGRS